jgi:hypothetical protein
LQEKYMNSRQYFAGDYSKQVYFHIKQNYPYWNRSAGRDHIWVRRLMKIILESFILFQLPGSCL